MIKNWIIRKAMKWISREEMFRTLFCPTDQIVIINALWRRSKIEPKSDHDLLPKPFDIKQRSAELAKQLSQWQ